MGSEVSGGGRGFESAWERAGVWGAGEEEEGPASELVSPVGTDSTASSSGSGSLSTSGAVTASDSVVAVSMDAGRECFARAGMGRPGGGGGIDEEADAAAGVGVGVSTLGISVLVDKVNGFFFGEVCALLPAPLCTESVLRPLDIADAMTFFSRLTAGMGMAEGVGRGKASGFFVSGMRLDLLRVAAGAGAGGGRTGVRPVPIGLPQLADPGSAASMSA